MHGSIDGTRRRPLGALGAVALAPMVPVFAPAARAQPLPDRYTPRAAPARLSMLGPEHPQTDLWVYNGRVPGPVLRVRQGERLRVDVVNDLPEATTVHWHGLRLPNAMDGVPGVTQEAATRIFRLLSMDQLRELPLGKAIDLVAGFVNAEVREKLLDERLLWERTDDLLDDLASS